MTKARFMEQQQPVIVVEKDKTYVYICLNGKEVKEENTNMESETSEPTMMYEYDYNEIIEDLGTLDIEDIKANPENYLNYEKEVEKTDKERIAELEAMNSEMSATLDSILTDVLPALMMNAE